MRIRTADSRTLLTNCARRCVQSPKLALEDDEGLQLILGSATLAEALLELPEGVREAAGESGELYWDDDEHCWIRRSSFLPGRQQAAERRIPLACRAEGALRGAMIRNDSWCKIDPAAEGRYDRT